MSELTKEGLKLLIPYYYRSEEDLLEEAFRIVIRNKPKIRIELALELYKNKKASLAKSAEIAGLVYFDIKGILRAFYKQNVLESEEIRDLVEAIEEEDNTRIKGFEAVFE